MTDTVNEDDDDDNGWDKQERHAQIWLQRGTRKRRHIVPVFRSDQRGLDHGRVGIFLTKTISENNVADGVDTLDLMVGPVYIWRFL